MWSPRYLPAEATSATTEIPPSTDASDSKTNDPLILDGATLFSGSGSDSTRTVLDDMMYDDVVGDCESPASTYKPQVVATSDRWKRPYDWFHDNDGEGNARIYSRIAIEISPQYGLPARAILA